MREIVYGKYVIAALVAIVGFSPGYAQDAIRQSDLSSAEVQAVIKYSFDGDPWHIVAREFRFGTGVGIGSSRPFAFSSDGQYFAFSRGSTLFVINVESGDTVQRIELIESDIDHRERLVSVISFGQQNQQLYASCFGTSKGVPRLYEIPIARVGSSLDEQAETNSREQIRATFLGVAPK